MARVRRPELAADAHRLNLEQLARLGGQVKLSRKRRGLIQRELGGMVGLSQASVSDIENGKGGSYSVDTWQRLALALDRPLRVDLSRDTAEATADAGHLGIQELLLRLGRAAGFRASFELHSRPSDPSRSTDVGLRDDRRRLLVLLEAVNTIGDIGAAARSSERKTAEVRQLAVVAGDGQGYRVASCWVVRSTARNRVLLARYPEVFAARFPGSSHAWVRALTQGSEPPPEPGLVWCDRDCTRLYAWRRQPARR